MKLQLLGRRVPRLVFLSLLTYLLSLYFLFPLNFLDRTLLEFKFLLSYGRAESELSPHTVIVTLDSHSEQVLGVPMGSEWRRFYPEFLAILHDAGAAVITFDLQFLGQEPLYDETFRAALVSAGNVIAGENEKGTLTESLAGAFQSIGSLYISAKRGVPRKVMPFRSAYPIPALSVATAELYTAATDSVRSESLLPVLKEGSDFWINFSKPITYFPQFSFVDVLSAADGRMQDSRRTPLSIFKNKAVYIGNDLPSIDRYPLPNSFGQVVPGVFGQAYAFETILENNAIVQAPIWVNAVSMVGMTLLLSFILILRSSLLRRISIILVPLCALAAHQFLFSQFFYWLNSSSLIAVSLIMVLLHWLVERRLLRIGLSRAIGFDPQLVEQFRRELGKNGTAVEKNVCVLCADIRNYTTFVSQNDAEVVTRIIDDYLKKMEETITDRGGYINKYVGDEIVAVFGFPLSEEGAASRCAQTGLAMLHSRGQ